MGNLPRDPRKKKSSVQSQMQSTVYKEAIPAKCKTLKTFQKFPSLCTNKLFLARFGAGGLWPQSTSRSLTAIHGIYRVFGFLAGGAF
jgi:hypothetical protein